MSQKKATIEELIARLEEITGEMEHPDTGIDTSIKLYEEGLKIADICRKRLQDARQKIEVINPETSSGQEPEKKEDYGLFNES
ncbi:MAG: exodeoxyribonuclease VII small subunit [Chlorobium sp.]|nr:exodeoxyribonuclease VII small subunit [Chlorobium sp.]MCW8820450.1 exodeoxyribonuclease VII small subunit [Ignavibacteriaceae bacterium]